MDLPAEHHLLLLLRPELRGGGGGGGGEEEQQQMLHLNRRLEAYLNRVRLLEEENALLEKEIQAARRSGRGAGALRRSSMEEELQRARLEAEAAWRHRLLAELEVGRMAEELRALDLRRQREARATAAAGAALQRSRGELEEELRARAWLTEREAQLEHQVGLLVQTHRGHVARLEAQRPRAPGAQREDHTAILLQLGREFSHRAATAGREAMEARRGQLARLEESLRRAGGGMALVEQERRQSQLELRGLEEELTAAVEVRQQLEEAAAQQSDVQQREVRQLQEHLEGLEAEKEQIGQQMDVLVLENGVLLQTKTSLGLEVATYRALLDGEGSALKRPKIGATADAFFSPRGVKANHQIPSSRYRTTPFQSAVTRVAPARCRKPAAPEATTQETSDTKTRRGEAVERFRPQEVREEVPRAEPPSASDEPEAPAGSGEVEELQDKAGPPVETPAVESVVSHQVESFLSAEPSLNGDDLQSTPSHAGATEDRRGASGKSKEVRFQGAADEEDAPVDTWAKEPGESERDDSSDSETEAMLEPTSESGTSSPESECVSEEMVTEFNLDVNAAEMRRRLRGSAAGRKETDADDKLYPDGEEMDTWDSVIERKVNLGTGGGMKSDGGERQHAEPEEDISEHRKGEVRRRTDVQQEDNMASSQVVSKQEDDDQQTVLERRRADRVSDEDEEDEDDSQNVSVSWRTEPEGDSYAQDNTLADTRPLIRYKSDETDGNAHADESELSEGEQDRRAKEAGMETWTEDKAKRFGTMEDLCEEIEGEVVDEPYGLAYVQTEETDVGQGSAAGEQPRPASGAANAEHKVAEESEKRSEGETGKRIKPISRDHDEELETDRVGTGLAQEELASLTAEGFSAHFAERQVREETEATAQEVTKPQEAEETKTERMKTKSEDKDLVPSSTVTNQVSEDLHSTASSVVTDQTDTVAEWDVQHEDGEPEDTSETREEDNELHVSVMTKADATEIQSGFTDRLLSDTEEINITEDSKSLAADQKNHPDEADCTEDTEAILTATKVSHEELVKHHQEISDKLQQAQAGNIAETSKESQVTGSQELSHSQPGGDVKDRQELSSVLQKSPSYDQSEASGGSQDEPVEEAAGGQKLFDFLRQVPGDDFMEASEDQPGEEAVELGSSSDSQPDHFQDKSKEAQDKLLEDCPEDILTEASKKSEEHRTEDAADVEDFPAAPETAEWEVLENPTELCEIQEISGQKRSVEARSHDDGAETHGDESPETSPDSLPGRRDIFALKDATESRLSDFFPPGVKSDFWVTSLGGGATFQPEDNAAAELADQNTGFAGNEIWGSSDTRNVVNRNATDETGLIEPQAAGRDEKETGAEVKQVAWGNVAEGEPGHSEESEVDGESWSSSE